MAPSRVSAWTRHRLSPVDRVYVVIRPAASVYVSGSPHLHFSVHVVNDPNRWWKGRDLNPYKLLRGASPAGSP